MHKRNISHWAGQYRAGPASEVSNRPAATGHTDSRISGNKEESFVNKKNQKDHYKYDKENSRAIANYQLPITYAVFFFVSRLCFSTSIRSFTVAVVFLGSAI